MRRFGILGNSGSGKTWLARELSSVHGLPVLDLDTIVWEPGKVAMRRSESAVLSELDSFLSANEGWIVEGCYGGLIEHALTKRPVLIFLNPGADKCKQHCMSRPHEPEKYKSKEDQDAMLQFLLEWVEGYYSRQDDMSLFYHRGLFDAYAGVKEERT
jgi:adenylate kinase family enzyme